MNPARLIDVIANLWSFLEGWVATSPGPRSDVDHCERLIEYAINDA
jgi:hypothetical protein